MVVCPPPMMCARNLHKIFRGIEDRSLHIFEINPVPSVLELQASKSTKLLYDLLHFRHFCPNVTCLKNRLHSVMGLAQHFGPTLVFSCSTSATTVSCVRLSTYIMSHLNDIISCLRSFAQVISKTIFPELGRLRDVSLKLPHDLESTSNNSIQYSPTSAFGGNFVLSACGSET